MKKILLILSLALPCTLLAGNVTPKRAQAVAERFFPSATTRGGSTVTLKWDGRAAQTRSSATNPAFYVFDHASGGFVIVAGDDCVAPVLGYSESGEFRVEGMPDNMRYWFDWITEGVEYLRSKNTAPTAAVRSAWQAYEGAATRANTGMGGGKQLETAHWDQYAPYNTKVSAWCNFAEGAVYTGCVATATAIIMRYHRYPARGTGDLSGYGYTDGKYRSRYVKGYSLGADYDWDNMLLDYGNGYTTAQGDAVAQLMMDCGVMVQMMYGTMDTSGSSADNAGVPKNLIAHMGYDKSVERVDRGLVSAEEWIRRLTQSIDNGCPVLFNADGNRGAHAFVLDGYDRENNIRINWGWSGHNNGYYTIPDFGDFPVYQTAYVNIRPDEGGEAPLPPIVLHSNMSWTEAPSLYDASTLQMKLDTGFAYNPGTGTFAGDVYLSHVDRNDVVKRHLEHMSPTNLAAGDGYGYEWTDRSYTLDMATVEEGDKIKWFYKPAGTDTLLPVPTNREYAHVNGLEIVYDLGSYRIEAGTSVEYLASERRIVVRTLADASCELLQSNGNAVTAGTTFSGGTLTVDVKALRSGTYTLRIKSGNAVKDVKLVL